MLKLGLKWWLKGWILGLYVSVSFSRRRRLCCIISLAWHTLYGTGPILTLVTSPILANSFLNTHCHWKWASGGAWFRLILCTEYLLNNLVSFCDSFFYCSEVEKWVTFPSVLVSFLCRTGLISFAGCLWGLNEIYVWKLLWNVSCDNSIKFIVEAKHLLEFLSWFLC